MTYYNLGLLTSEQIVGAVLIFLLFLFLFGGLVRAVGFMAACIIAASAVAFSAVAMLATALATGDLSFARIFEVFQ